MLNEPAYVSPDEYVNVPVPAQPPVSVTKDVFPELGCCKHGHVYKVAQGYGEQCARKMEHGGTRGDRFLRRRGYQLVAETIEQHC